MTTNIRVRSKISRGVNKTENKMVTKSDWSEKLIDWARNKVTEKINIRVSRKQSQPSS